VDVQLHPTTQVKILICHGQFATERQLSVYQTTNELKALLEQILQIPSAQMRIFYIDPELQGVFGREELRLPEKQLYSYNMQDGDEIHVELKNSPP
jgi:antitoxin component of MazEF toxin-antitoxin module